MKKPSPIEFVLKFALLFGIPYILIHVVDIGLATNAVASVEAAMFRTGGFAVSQNAALLFVEGFPFEIVADCTGLMMVFLLLALLWATPVEEKRRVRAFLIWTPFLLGFNLLRMFVTLYVGFSAPSLMDVAHVVLWFVDAGVVILIWMHEAEVVLW
ncbi:Transmembrane exosortase (Exosortase_EpsH) [Candidatus Norongarragalina meridionalis]|nr:Transmembrane exosortase (Exosortase_EpsH) [Candidatus Norongarragalina meridionalis]